MNLDFEIRDQKKFSCSVEKGSTNGRIEMSNAVGIYYSVNGGLIIPNSISDPTSVKIYGTNSEHISFTRELLGGLK